MAAILPFWNRDDLFFYNISIILRWISISTAVLTKTHSSFKPLLFGLRLCACFLCLYISSRHWWYRLMLWFEIKSTEVHATEVSALFQSNYEALLSRLYIHFYQSMKMSSIKPLHISQNSPTKPPESREYLDCFTGLTVSWSPPLHVFIYLDCFTVLTVSQPQLFAHTDLGSRGYFGV